MAVAIISLITALIPLLVAFIDWMQKRHNLGPAQRRRIGVVLGHVRRLRERCDEIETHSARLGCRAEDGEVTSEGDE